MSILKNENYANKTLITANGEIQFNENGEVELPEATARILSTLKGFTVIEVEPLEKDDIDRETLKKRNVLQLKKFARENSIELGEATTKEEIINKILGS